jgi:hypothetical protein
MSGNYVGLSTIITLDYAQLMHHETVAGATLRGTETSLITLSYHLL